ncbi:MAG: amylo-alpha-1,6-glucosidase [Lachnospiraceae bacterium]|nr:amylo-alpha-1,6-glucosidase [Lachnospiraceae bacterium]
MRFLYGKNDFATLERGQENCYLMTNGLGGFSSMTMVGSCARNDHALLMSCEKEKAPNHRYNMVHHLTEELVAEDSRIFLSSQQYKDEKNNEDGWHYQTSFSYEIHPIWNSFVSGVTVEKTVVMAHGRNIIGVRYEICNRSKRTAVLSVTPGLQFVPKGHLLSKEQKFIISDLSTASGLTSLKIEAAHKSLYIQTNGSVLVYAPEYRDDFYYSYDARDGRPDTGACVKNHCVEFTVPAGANFTGEILYSTEPLEKQADMGCGFDLLLREMEERYQTLTETSGLKTPLSQTLVYAADSFISYRASTDKETILAGFPFFEDWGRDTMISLPGLCLSTGRFDLARNILDTFAQHCKRGLMPNLFPEGKNEPMYNTADAALLFIITVYEYYSRTSDVDYVRSVWPVMKEIVHDYMEGTDYNIHMDEDGLIIAGSGLDQVTWMDVRIGDILPTPRHGKPVEINAYWYNALRIMEAFQKICDSTGCNKFDYSALAEKVRLSFEQEFWNPETGCLRDVLSGTENAKCDNQIRCNQIWAVSLPFSILSPEKEKQVVDVVFEKLYTPTGLRTLNPEDPQFHSNYGGSMLSRDLAYHQGTVWTFPLGAYYLAYLKVNGYSRESQKTVEKQLDGIAAALREGCVGQLPEIYDGLEPVFSRGCFAQAWSVGEILRVCEALKKIS